MVVSLWKNTITQFVTNTCLNIQRCTTQLYNLLPWTGLAGSTDIKAEKKTLRELV